MMSPSESVTGGGDGGCKFGMVILLVVFALVEHSIDGGFISFGTPGFSVPPYSTAVPRSGTGVDSGGVLGAVVVANIEG